eukprot:6202043-Pleurochrysis_carterae.AAC.2
MKYFVPKYLATGLYPTVFLGTALHSSRGKFRAIGETRARSNERMKTLKKEHVQAKKPFSGGHKKAEITVHLGAGVEERQRGDPQGRQGGSQDQRSSGRCDPRRAASRARHAASRVSPARLHARPGTRVRALLPILPSLFSSSPFSFIYFLYFPCPFFI